MKKLFYIAVVSAAMLFISCDKDNNGGNDDGRLVGRWEAVADYELKNGQWAVIETYKANESVMEFTADNLIQYSYGEKIGPTQTYNLDRSKMTLTLMGIVMKVYKLTDTEFDLEEPGYPTEMKTTFKRIN